jgi:hypothetical protein
MTTPTSSVNNRSRHETRVEKRASVELFTLVSQPASLVFIQTIRYFVLSLQIFKEEFENTTGVIRIGKSKKNKQRSTKHAHKTKDGVTRTPLKLGVNSNASEV